MTNLDLGDVIWLNVSHELLSLHRWFFTPLDKLPKEVYEVFEHHSHTHPNATVTTGSNSHACANTYVFSVVCGVACTGFNHSHILIGYDFSSSGAHTHDIVVSFGSAGLGVPWWNHVHSVTRVSCTNAGPNHSHVAPVLGNDGCLDSVGLHTHPHTITVTAMLFSHQHTLAASNTNTANPAESPTMPPGHTHTFTLTIVINGSHNHTTGGAVTSNLCAGSGGAGCNHTHTRPTTILSPAHLHTGSGTTALGGEAPAVSAPLGDGLVFIG